MKPTSPVMPSDPTTRSKEIVYAKDQPEYLPLPSLRDREGVVLSRWKLSWQERLQALFFGDVFLAVWTFRSPLQPLWLGTHEPQWFKPEIPYEQPDRVPGPPDPPRHPKDRPVA